MRGASIVMFVKRDGWYPDPSGLHGERWISAGHPTHLVRDAWVESYDDAPRKPQRRVPLMTAHAASGAANCPLAASRSDTDRTSNFRSCPQSAGEVSGRGCVLISVYAPRSQILILDEGAD